MNGVRVDSRQTIVIHCLHSNEDHGQRFRAESGQLCRHGSDVVDDVTEAVFRARKHGESDAASDIKDMMPVKGQVLFIQ